MEIKQQLKQDQGNVIARILISLLGIAFIMWGLGTLLLGSIGERDMASITSIRRQGGERNDVEPGRYTYSIGYTFTLPDGKRVDGSATKTGNAIFIKADGKSSAPVRYFKELPFVNTLEENTKPSLGQSALVIVGVFLIALVNKRKKD